MCVYVGGEGRGRGRSSSVSSESDQFALEDDHPGEGVQRGKAGGRETLGEQQLRQEAEKQGGLEETAEWGWRGWAASARC